MNGFNEKRFAFLLMRDDDVYLVMEHREKTHSHTHTPATHIHVVLCWLMRGGPGICIELSMNVYVRYGAMGHGMARSH